MLSLAPEWGCLLLTRALQEVEELSRYKSNTVTIICLSVGKMRPSWFEDGWFVGSGYEHFHLFPPPQHKNVINMSSAVNPKVIYSRHCKNCCTVLLWRMRCSCSSFKFTATQCQDWTEDSALNTLGQSNRWSFAAGWGRSTPPLITLARRPALPLVDVIRAALAGNWWD